jgi:hypothetical protein
MIGASACRGQTEPQSGAVSLTPYCNRAVEIDSVPLPVAGEKSSSDERVQPTSAYAGRLVLLYEEQRRSAPEALAGDIEKLITLYREVVRSDDSALLSGQDIRKYRDRLHSFEVANCKFERVQVGAVDYAYEGLSETEAAGVVSFELNNRGAESHELALYRKNDGVKDPLDKLLKQPRAKFEEKVKFVGVASTPPGGTDYALARLTPGDYAVVCFQPTGKAGGPPHHTKGMFEEFKVS